MARPSRGGSDLWDQVMPTTWEAADAPDTTGPQSASGYNRIESTVGVDGGTQPPVDKYSGGGWDADSNRPQADRSDVLAEALIAGERAGLMKTS